ncbi:bifunctional 3'-5' exonuclease/DNA polymerase [Salinibacterium sp. G-O1]|uniref:bifunctional 3'-5' exonuclease/DNA polymerase n=1 Tax=Salinibacterium sp. G-O1 TaxID=3046208 RepID=UPI0024BB96E2|nr:bifunctional 3'-5' exonuclease/DNA polymerase [Salinibacterium sp. G-O1]MDJ0335322.1 bifunctional 3'-5' exonuclease/DNA polymerase [Salinibacterium sp. G-O1]
MHIVLDRTHGDVRATTVSDSDEIVRVDTVADLAAFVADREREHPRWVWDDTSRWYPQLLAAGVRVDRCFDLRLCHAILRASSLTADSDLALAGTGPWDAPPQQSGQVVSRPSHSTLFDLDQTSTRNEGADADGVAEFQLQRAAVAGCPEPARIGRLLAAESAGSLVAAEMRFAGLPWSSAQHDAILTAFLGPRPAVDGARPQKLQAALDLVRSRLEAPELNPDSPADLMRALGLAGLQVSSTRSWELRKLKHPAIEPLLEYKKLARLLASNGWVWRDTWVVNDRFRPDYVPGGAATGRWATSGGGALQLPRQIRAAVVADDGWKLVVADASQLEPRILAAMAGDRGMIEAGSAGDLYAGIVASGAVETRDQAKVAMLGAMYGATTGESGRLMPKLARAYPRAISMVESAARAGERGEVVTTRLGRSSAPGSSNGSWSEGVSSADATRARERSRAWGRFTRNFIVQGTAAEWALCWMASIRRRMDDLNDHGVLTDGPHLVFFLHDEVVVHAPAHLADRVAAEINEAAAEAGRLLFGALPAEFPLTIAIVDDYGQAK